MGGSKDEQAVGLDTEQGLDAMVDYWEQSEPTEPQIDAYYATIGELLTAELLSSGALPASKWSADLDRHCQEALRTIFRAAVERQCSRWRLELVQGGTAAEDNAPRGAQEE